MKQLIYFLLVWMINLLGLAPTGFVIKYSKEGKKQMSVNFRRRNKTENERIT